MKTAPCFTACRKRWDAYESDMHSLGVFSGGVYLRREFTTKRGYGVSTTNVYSLDTSEITHVNDCET